MLLFFIKTWTFPIKNFCLSIILRHTLQTDNKIDPNHASRAFVIDDAKMAWRRRGGENRNDAFVVERLLLFVFIIKVIVVFHAHRKHRGEHDEDDKERR